MRQVAADARAAVRRRPARYSDSYLDIPLAFASGLPESQLVRALSSKDQFEERLRQATPTLRQVLVVPGSLGDRHADRFEFRALRFCVAERFTYATVYRAWATPRLSRRV